MLSTESEVQLEALLKQVLALRDILLYERIPASSPSRSSCRSLFSGVKEKIRGRKRRERDQNHHGNHRRGNQQLQQENTESSNGNLVIDNMYLAGYNQLECQVYHSPVTVKHILIDCTCFSAAHQRYLEVDTLKKTF